MYLNLFSMIQLSQFGVSFKIIYKSYSQDVNVSIILRFFLRSVINPAVYLIIMAVSLNLVL